MTLWVHQRSLRSTSNPKGRQNQTDCSGRERPKNLALLDVENCNLCKFFCCLVCAFLVVSFTKRKKILHFFFRENAKTSKRKEVEEFTFWRAHHNCRLYRACLARMSRKNLRPLIEFDPMFSMTELAYNLIVFHSMYHNFRRFFAFLDDINCVQHDMWFWPATMFDFVHFFYLARGERSNNSNLFRSSICQSLWNLLCRD